ncbi:flavin reductase family protein [candidate division KSB1 bacterium]|nr:flavin reductase [candidate division KSB1 bacterium]RQV99747.1 MAG: flavin reductase family protein [candidate division KSB1 bacterium]
MAWRIIPVNDFDIKIFDAWDKRWFALTAGDFRQQHYNTMTVAWGSLGIMWNKPFAQVVVRPTRYTFEFMEQYDSFTLCAFDRRFRSALQLLGSRSGRDSDKIAESGLTLIPSQRIAAPAFAEADIIIECVKMYWQDFDPSHFLDPDIEKTYRLRDYHRIYFGRILTIQCRDDSQPNK